ncbi:MAG: hypothetical protein K9M99_12915 [Candidatus Cloacimonetes bacterium]|nr:hypothetical protein [Candidatus Cloacimonadota bacterium]
MKNYVILFIMLFICVVYCQDVITVELPAADTLKLESFATFNFAEINESSAIVKSRQWDDVYWTLNDSGDKNRIFPFNRNGEMYRAQWYSEDQGGVYIGDAVNIDWESMTADDEGNLYIGACGNNLSVRRDLCIYKFKDPHPLATGTTRYLQKINFYYPEQSSYPAPEDDSNYDCEAIFWAEGRLFLLTKHRSDTNTCLYTLNSMYSERENPATLLSTFDIQGAVTDAECNDDGTRLAVLTYSAVWVFEGETEYWFEGSVKWLPISGKQCEGICWDDDETLIITNEQMELFELKTSELIQVR